MKKLIVNFKKIKAWFLAFVGKRLFTSSNNQPTCLHLQINADEVLSWLLFQTSKRHSK